MIRHCSFAPPPRRVASIVYGMNAFCVACRIRSGALPLAPEKAHVGVMLAGMQRTTTFIVAVAVAAADGSSVGNVSAVPVLRNVQDCPCAGMQAQASTATNSPRMVAADRRRTRCVMSRRIRVMIGFESIGCLRGTGARNGPRA